MKEIAHSHGMLHCIYLIDELEIPIDFILIRVSIGGLVRYVLIEGKLKMICHYPRLEYTLVGLVQRKGCYLSYLYLIALSRLRNLEKKKCSKKQSREERIKIILSSLFLLINCRSVRSGIQ